MELPLKTPITFFVRVRGKKGERELRALLDPSATHMTIPPVDATRLGYPFQLDPGAGEKANTLAGPVLVSRITLQEVAIGELSAENVEAVVYDFPPEIGADVIIGASFLRNFKTTLDYKRGILTIEEQ